VAGRRGRAGVGQDRRHRVSRDGLFQIAVPLSQHRQAQRDSTGESMLRWDRCAYRQHDQRQKRAHGPRQTVLSM
jgi:hypothetical protein